jgi:GntR family transcriptional regulator/MocR family aminotransferase
MSARRRAALMEFAQARGAVVIEDDYDAEFRFGDRPLDALQTLDRSESVFYVGTFSKSLFPSIRLGFVVAPPWAHDALGAVKQYTDWHCAVLMQETLAAFISEGHLARHVRRMRAIYADRRSVLLDGLKTQFSSWLQPLPSSAGLHLTATANDVSLDVDALVERARERDVGINSLARFHYGKPCTPGIVFGYGALDRRDIPEALTRLRAIISR